MAWYINLFTTEHGVAQSYVHTTFFVTSFRLWDDVPICCNSEVISTSVRPPCSI